MSEEQKENKCKTTGNHYSEFSLDEFNENSPYTVQRLCDAIKADNYGLKFHNSSDNSIDRLNEILECPVFFQKMMQNKIISQWSADVQYLLTFFFTLQLTSENLEIFSELKPDEQINIKRLNRLLLEETYPKETPKSSKYFIPPGLVGSVYDFENHYKAAKGEPILIIGQTGVGKSLFLHIFEKLYREEHRDEIKHPIIKANCAHFGGDPNLVRSELFGHMEGSFTDARFDKKGFVEMANGGVLILEEIGDLPPESQAAILTFIETGEYYCVGYDSKKSNKKAGPQRANIQIVGLTNKADDMREDLKYRFFPFYVKPIHERREDILYYFYAMLPNLFHSMKPNEIFALLTYHWPGNVREIERVCRLLMRKGYLDSVKFYNLDPYSNNNSIELLNIDRFRDDLLMNNIDVEFLESILNYYQLGIKRSIDTNVFFNIGDCEVDFNEFYERYGLRFTYKIKSFEKAHLGIMAFSELFYHDRMDSFNLIDLKEGLSFGDPFDKCFVYPKDGTDRFQKLLKSIFEYLSGIKLLESDRISENVFERDNFFRMLGKANPGNPFLAALGFTELIQGKETKDFDISSLKYEDLLSLYYQNVYDRAGTYEKAAKIAGMSAANFGEMYNKLVRKKFRKRNIPLKIS